MKLTTKTYSVERNSDWNTKKDYTEKVSDVIDILAQADIWDEIEIKVLSSKE